MVILLGKKVCFKSFLTIIYLIINVKCQEEFTNEPSISGFLIDNETTSIINNESNLHLSEIENNDMTTDSNNVIHEINKRSTNIYPPKSTSQILNEHETVSPIRDTPSNLAVPHFKDGSSMNKNQLVQVQKCCEDDEIYLNKSCQKFRKLDFNVDIYDSNDTHYWKMNDYTVKTVKKMVDCSQRVSFPVIPNMSDIDFWLILENGKLYFKNDYSFFDTSEYCVDRGLNDLNETFVMVLMCVPAEVQTSQFYVKVFKCCALAVSVLSLIILVTYKYNDSTYPNDCKNCFMLMFIALATAYLAWALYTIVNDSLTGFRQVLWVIRFYCSLCFHCFLLFFYIELYRNVSLTAKKSTHYLLFYIAMANIIPIILFAIVFTTMKEIPPTSLEESPNMDNGIVLYFLCYYIPCGLSIIACCIISIWLHLAQVSTIKPDLNETLRRLMRQNSRTTAGKERILYKKCYFLIAMLFCCWCINITLYSLSLNYETVAPKLDNYNSITYIAGVFCAILFVPTCTKLCGNNNTSSNAQEQTALRDLQL